MVGQSGPLALITGLQEDIGKQFDESGGFTERAMKSAQASSPSRVSLYDVEC